MAAQVTAPELEQFLCHNIQLTGIVLGAGAYGSVEEVEIPGARVAAKKLHPQLINLGSPQQVQKWVTDFVEECKLMSQLRHPHIVQFLGVCYLTGSSLPALLMEKLQTSLDSLLETTPNIPLDVKVYLLTGTGQGVVYLHSHTPPIAHRDLTARNILIDSGMNAKIADLGVAKMVNIKPGQLAATMTNAPGNNLYMPPEAVQEEGATRYNTAIDIFSFGVVSLFTLTQTFPKDLKPASFFDPVSRRVLGRTEIERRDEYVKLMTVALGQTHLLVKLTLDCLEFLPEDRPPAQEVLRQLEEFGMTMPQSCTDYKLQLIQQKDDLTKRKEEEIQLILTENQKQLSEKDAQLHQLQTELSERCAQIETLQVEAATNSLQAADKQQQVHKFEELTILQQQQLDVKQKEIEQLSSQLKSLEIQPREEQGVSPHETTPPKKDELEIANQQLEEKVKDLQSQLNKMIEENSRLHKSMSSKTPPSSPSTLTPVESEEETYLYASVDYNKKLSRTSRAMKQDQTTSPSEPITPAGDKEDPDSVPVSTDPPIELVHSHIKALTQVIQELLKAAKSRNQAQYSPCCRNIAQAVDSLLTIFPTKPASQTVQLSLQEVYQTSQTLQTRCQGAYSQSDLAFRTRQIISSAYDVAKAARHLVMCVEQDNKSGK